MADYKPKYNQGINWAVIARNDEAKLNKGCKGCKFADPSFHCRYLLDMGPGHSRVKLGVKMRPGGGCDLYTPRRKQEKTAVRPGIMIAKGVAQKMREAARTGPIDLTADQEAQTQALDLYRKGAGDAQIAATVGTSKQAVADWRKANGLVSNHTKFRKET